MLLTWRKCFLRRFGRCYAHLYVFGDLFPEVIQLLSMILYDRPDLLLQPLTMSKLLVNKRLHLTPVSSAACFGFTFVLFSYFGVFSGEPIPNPLEALR